MQKQSIQTLGLDLTNKHFILYAIGIAIFCFFVFKSPSKSDKDKRFKEATRKALGALIIAYLSHLNMIFAPFFAVFTMDYFLSGWS